MRRDRPERSRRTTGPAGRRADPPAPLHRPIRLSVDRSTAPLHH
ncbi:hypothetical protein ACFSEO_12270 [Agromyces cerinus subsp. nitratus]